MPDLDKKPRRQTPSPDEPAPSDVDVLPWQAWAAFCDFHEDMQAIYTQIGSRAGTAPTTDALWNFFITVVYSNPEALRGGCYNRPRWRSLAEWCHDAEVIQD